MENKGKRKSVRKRFMVIGGIFFLLLFMLWGLVRQMELRAYQETYNEKLIRVYNYFKNRTEEDGLTDFIRIMNEEGRLEELPDLADYGIDLQKEGLLEGNERTAQVFFFIYLGLFLFFLAGLVFLVLVYQSWMTGKIDTIARMVRRVNRGNFYPDMSPSEEDLSMLKSEIFKTTVMLKESADRSGRERVQLKDNLSDISHQLKTPLANLRIILDNLQTYPEMPGDERQKFVFAAKRETGYIQDFIQVILKLSRFDAGVINFQREDLEICALLRELADKLALLAELKEVDLIFPSDQEATIHADRAWQLEALTNVVKNGIEHSEAGGKVLIELSPTPTYLEIRIMNRGYLTEADKKHLFDRFYKGEKANSQSVGIGLSLAKTIIEQDGGTITAENVDGWVLFRIRYYHLRFSDPAGPTR